MTAILEEDELLDVQVKAMQSGVPKHVRWQGKNTPLSKVELLAVGRAIWFIIKKGYGRSTAISRVRRSFPRVQPGKMHKAIMETFPKDYFIALEKGKNRVFVRTFEGEE